MKMTKKIANPEYAELERDLKYERTKLIGLKRSHQAKKIKFQQLSKDSKKMEESLQKLIERMAECADEVGQSSSLEIESRVRIEELINNLKQTPKTLSE